MANTFSQIYLHLVFSTKNREAFIHQDIEERLWAFMGGIAKRHGMTPIQIGGMEDHSYACVGVPTTMSASQAAKHIKGDSSLWLHQEFSELRSLRGRTDMERSRFRDQPYRMWLITSRISERTTRSFRLRMNIGRCCVYKILSLMTGICWVVGDSIVAMRRESRVGLVPWVSTHGYNQASRCDGHAGRVRSSRCGA